MGGIATVHELVTRGAAHLHHVHQMCSPHPSQESQARAPALLHFPAQALEEVWGLF